MTSTKITSFPGGVNSAALGPDMEYLIKCMPGLSEATVRDWRKEAELNKRYDGLNVTSRPLGVRIT